MEKEDLKYCFLNIYTAEDYEMLSEAVIEFIRVVASNPAYEHPVTILSSLITDKQLVKDISAAFLYAILVKRLIKLGGQPVLSFNNDKGALLRIANECYRYFFKEELHCYGMNNCDISISTNDLRYHISQKINLAYRIKNKQLKFEIDRIKEYRYILAYTLGMTVETILSNINKSKI